MGRTIGVLVGLLLVAAGACAPGERGPDTATPEVLAFSAPLVGGGTFEGEDYTRRDVALWFWAPW